MTNPCPQPTTWVGPNWMTVRKDQWFRRCLFRFLLNQGFVVRDQDLERFGHGFRVYRLTADIGRWV